MKALGLKWKISLIGLFSVFYLLTSTVIYGNQIIVQTLYNLLIIGILMSFLLSWQVKNLSERFIKILLLGFWAGQAFMYLYNFKPELTLDEWFYYFNDYELFVPVYVISFILSVIYTHVSDTRISKE